MEISPTNTEKWPPDAHQTSPNLVEEQNWKVDGWNSAHVWIFHIFSDSRSSSLLALKCSPKPEIRERYGKLTRLLGG